VSRPGAGGAGTRLPGIADGNRPGGDRRPGEVVSPPFRPDRPGKDVRPGGGGGGIQKDISPPFRPDRPGKDVRPGGGGGGIQKDISPPFRPDRPGGGGDRWPGGNDRRPIRPNTNRPIINRDVNIGNRTNNVINRRPNWVNINNTQINNINNQWYTAINRPGMGNWRNQYPARNAYWNGWANGVRDNWGYYHNHQGWFGGDWWSRYHFGQCGWHYNHWLPYYPYNYWWSQPAWPAVTTWVSGAAAVAAQPVYYDYGTGGNVVYQDNTVYIGGQQVASAADFAESAAALATVPPPANEEEAAKAEWMPLGTFALSTGKDDKEPSRIVQLAVSKSGVVSGTLFNHQTDQANAIQGQVDKETQRVAIRIGEAENLVLETGLYNLTQNEAPALIHFGKEKTENYLLVRLQSEEGKEGGGQ
jgi:hypothetical protein